MTLDEKKKDWAKRNAEIFKWRRTGMTLKKVGSMYGLGVERVRQICARTGRLLQQEGLSGNEDFDQIKDYVAFYYKHRKKNARA